MNCYWGDYTLLAVLLRKEVLPPNLLFLIMETITKDYLITINKRKNTKWLSGGTKHNAIASYIIVLLIKSDYRFATETSIFLTKEKVTYKVDILSWKDKIVIFECGNTSQSKLRNLRKYFEVIRISYKQFSILQDAKTIKDSINVLLF